MGPDNDAAPDNVTPVASAGAAGERITPSGPDSSQISCDPTVGGYVTWWLCSGWLMMVMMVVSVMVHDGYCWLSMIIDGYVCLLMVLDGC